MGAGLAKQFKEKYPDNFQWVNKRIKKSSISPGKIVFYDISFDRVIANFTTKDHWRNPSKMEWISSGLKELVYVAGNTTIAIPKIGCGLGGLNWQTVKTEIERILGDCEQLVEVYE